MSGVHSRAAAMKSLLRLGIFIKSSLDFFRGLRDVIAFSSNCKRSSQSKEVSGSRFPRDPSRFGTGEIVWSHQLRPYNDVDAIARYGWEFGSPDWQ